VLLPGPGKLDPASETPSVGRGHCFRCDLCGRACDGFPGGAGLFVWTRGDEMRFEEPPLCEQCATRITMGALSKWSLEPEE
jgi:hypothetical protein